MLYLADWVMNSHSVETVWKEHDKLRKKILSHYQEMGAEDMIEYSEENNDYYEPIEFDDYIHEKFIKAYDEETFWEELIDQLTKRDAIANIGAEKLQAMENEERFVKLGEISDHYGREFELHGLNRVKIDSADP